MSTHITTVAGAGTTDGSGTYAGTLVSSSFALAAGNTVVVTFDCNDSSWDATMADTAGNTYTRLYSVTGGPSGWSFECWYATNTSAHATNVVTATLRSGATAQYRRIHVTQYSGLATSSVVDTSAFADYSGSYATPFNFPSITTANANDTIICVGLIVPAPAATPSGFTDRNTAAVLPFFDMDVAATGTYAPSSSVSGTPTLQILGTIALKSSAAPVLSVPVATVTGSQTATVGATTDSGSGTLYCQVLPAADAAPSAATIIGAATASVAVSSTGAKTISVTGLTAATAYKVHLAQTGPSNVVSSSSFTTEAAPVLTSPTAGATGTSTASGSVTTNVTGTLYKYASTNATESAATVKASGSTFTVTSAGSQTGLTFTGLTPGSTYYAHYVLTRGGVDSSRVSSSSFVQSSAVAFSGTVPSQSGTVGSAFSLALSGYFSGTLTPFVYSVASGALPAGLSLNTSTGAISGTPTTAANYSAVVRATDTATNTANTGTISFSIGATGSSIAFSGTVPAKAVTVDTAFSWGTPTLASYFSGGTTPYTYAVTTGTLPTGLSLNTSTGVISGTPTATGTSALVITATDAAAGTAASNSFNIVVAAAGTASLTLQGFKYWTGTERASETVGFVKVIRASSGVVVLELTDQTISAGGEMVISNASLLAGNDYLVVGFPSGAAESFRKLVTAI